MGDRGYPVITMIGLAGTIVVATAILHVFLAAPAVAGLSGAQKIFYFHVASAINMLFAFGVCAIASGLFLTIRDPKVKAVADALAVSAAEVGVVLGSMVLVTGPLWASKEWGTFWIFEPRLTLSLMVFLLFLAYLALRSYAASDRIGRGVAAGMSLLGIPAIYFIHFAVERWGGNHPQVLFGGGIESPAVELGLWMSILGVALVSATLMCIRMAIEMQQRRVDELFLSFDRMEVRP